MSYHSTWVVLPGVETKSPTVLHDRPAIRGKRPNIRDKRLMVRDGPLFGLFGQTDRRDLRESRGESPRWLG